MAASAVSNRVEKIGLRLPGQALPELRRVGINTHEYSKVVVTHQEKANRWVLTAQESGGCVPTIGHAVAFLGVKSEPAPWSQRIETVVPNSIHRKVSGTALVRFEMYRFGSTCDLLVTLHWLDPQANPTHPVIRRLDLFSGRFGLLNIPLWEDQHKALRENIMPRFFNRTGEEIEVPVYLHDGVARITHTVCCVKCKHSHFETASEVSVPIPVIPPKTKVIAVSTPARKKKSVEPVKSAPGPTTTAAAFDPKGADAATQPAKRSKHSLRRERRRDKRAAERAAEASTQQPPVPSST